MSDMEKRVLDAIAARGLRPTPAYRFLAKRSVFWLLSVLSILLGAVTFAIALYAIANAASYDHEIFDEVPFEDILLGLPAVWLLIMPLLVASAYVGIRNTRRGYRLTTTRIVALTLAASLGLGALMHASGAGRRIHEYLAERFPAYHAFTYIPYDEWSRPDAGFLGGHADKLLDAKTLRLIDFRGTVWTVDIAGATIEFSESLEEEGDVAITGVRTGPTTFRAVVIAEFD